MEKFTILGQDPEILAAMLANLLSWFVSTFCPFLLPKLVPLEEQEEVYAFKQTNEGNVDTNRTKCISIGRPGGLEQLRVLQLKEGICTVGYNVKQYCLPPYTPPITPVTTIPSDCIVLSNKCFSVNYADCTIRWGLYESAKKFVGWPIVPGFDVAGEIERVGDSVTEFKAGDKVYGCTLFGSYSSRILIPKGQMRKIPEKLSFADAASLPAVSLTALYCLSLAGHFPGKNKFSNKAILIHSAAGGVGSMLVQMSKILGLSPIVGVVGSTKKVQEAKHLGCDVVIDKSVDDLWAKAEEAAPDGYKTICDANGVSTLTKSYGHLAQTGRLIIFGFHSNLPMGKHMLSPIEWIRMAKKMNSMPAFDPMDLTVSNKSVLGFNLSFFADEREVVGELFDQICIWLEEEKLRCPRVVTMKMENIGEAHSLIQSGSSVGKIVMEV